MLGEELEHFLQLGALRRVAPTSEGLPRADADHRQGFARARDGSGRHDRAAFGGVRYAMRRGDQAAGDEPQCGEGYTPEDHLTGARGRVDRYVAGVIL